MTILLTGGSGFLGGALQRRLARLGRVVAWGHCHAAPAAPAVDLRNAAAVRRLLDEVRPDVVVHTAAYRDPDFCETHPTETRALNVDGTAHLCAALPAGARMVYISTDYVFDGRRPPYAEDAPRAPLNEYGRSKAAAEDVTLAAGPQHAVLRVPLLVGADPPGRAPGFVRQLLAALVDPTPRTEDDVLVRCPTWIEDAAEAAARLIECAARGVWHFSGPDALTRYQCALALARALGKSADHLRPERHPPPRPAARPVNARLATDKIRALGGSLRFTPLTEIARALL